MHHSHWNLYFALNSHASIFSDEDLKKSAQDTNSYLHKPDWSMYKNVAVLM